MKDFTNTSVSLVSFYDIYSQTISPKLAAIDTFLKSEDVPYSPDAVAKLLNTDVSVLKEALDQLDISILDKVSFFKIVFYLPNEICKLIRKGWQYQNTSFYTPEIIADIYTLNISKVNAAFEELEINHVPKDGLDDVFKRIHTVIFTAQ